MFRQRCCGQKIEVRENKVGNCVGPNKVTVRPGGGEVPTSRIVDSQ